MALSAAAPVMIVPVPGRQFCGTWLDVPDAPLLELELPIATPPIATATAAAPAATNLVSLRENMETTPVVRWEYTESCERR